MILLLIIKFSLFLALPLTVPNTLSIAQKSLSEAFEITVNQQYIALYIYSFSSIQNQTQLFCQLNSNQPLSLPSPTTFQDIQSSILHKQTRYLLFNPSETHNVNVIYCQLLIPENHSTSYQVTTEGFKDNVCPLNCNKKGSCIQGLCSCIRNYIDYDCSMEAVIVNTVDQSSSYKMSSNIYFMAIQSSLPISSTRLLIKFSSSENMDIFIQIEDEYNLYAPSQLHYISKFSLTSNSPQQYLIIPPNTIFYSQTLQRNYRIIVGIYNNDINNLINVQIQTSSKSSDNNITLLIIYFFVGIVVISIISLIVVCIIRKYHSKEEQIFDENTVRRNPQNLKLKKIRIVESEEMMANYLPQMKYERILTQELCKNKFENGLNCDECLICLQQFSLNEDCRQTPCQHYFHKVCLELWLNKYENCPMCRNDLSVGELQKNLGVNGLNQYSNSGNVSSANIQIQQSANQNMNQNEQLFLQVAN